MNQELEKVTLWVLANKLSLNVGKIVIFMIFKSKNKNVQHKVTVQYVVLGPRLKVINLNILPESSRNKLKDSL